MLPCVPLTLSSGGAKAAEETYLFVSRLDFKQQSGNPSPEQTQISLNLQFLRYAVFNKLNLRDLEKNRLLLPCKRTVTLLLQSNWSCSSDKRAGSLVQSDRSSFVNSLSEPIEDSSSSSSHSCVRPSPFCLRQLQKRLPVQSGAAQPQSLLQEKLMTLQTQSMASTKGRMPMTDWQSIYEYAIAAQSQVDQWEQMLTYVWTNVTLKHRKHSCSTCTAKFHTQAVTEHRCQRSLSWQSSMLQVYAYCMEQDIICEGSCSTYYK